VEGEGKRRKKEILDSIGSAFPLLQGGGEWGVDYRLREKLIRREEERPVSSLFPLEGKEKKGEVIGALLRGLGKGAGKERLRVTFLRGEKDEEGSEGEECATSGGRNLRLPFIRDAKKGKKGVGFGALPENEERGGRKGRFRFQDKRKRKEGD